MSDKEWWRITFNILTWIFIYSIPGIICGLLLRLVLDF